MRPTQPATGITWLGSIGVKRIKKPRAKGEGGTPPILILISDLDLIWHKNWTLIFFGEVFFRLFSGGLYRTELDLIWLIPGFLILFTPMRGTE